MGLKEEISLVSAMDNFAKWARLKRTLEKKTLSYETTLRQCGTDQSSLDMKVGLGVRFLVMAAHLIFTYFYFSQPVLHFPQSWSGFPLNHILSMPNAPLGNLNAELTILNPLFQELLVSACGC